MKIQKTSNDIMGLISGISSPQIAAIVAGYVALHAAGMMVDVHSANEYNKAISQQSEEANKLIHTIAKFDAMKQTLLKVSRINNDLINQSRLITTFYGNNVQNVVYLHPSITNYYKYRIKKKYSVTDNDKANINILVQISTQVNSIIQIINKEILEK